MKEKVVNLAKNPFIQGGFFYTLSGYLGGVLNYFFNVLVGKSLGPKGYGEIVAFFSYLTIFSSIINIVSTLVIQKIASAGTQNEEVAAKLENWFWEKISRWFFLLIPFVLVIPFLPRLTNLSWWSSILLFPLIIIAFISAFYASIIQGLRLFLSFALIGLIAVSVKLAGAVLTSFGLGNLELVISFISFSILFTALANYFVYRQNHQSIVSKNPVQKRVVQIIFNRQILITSFSLIALSFLGNLDIVYAKKFLPANEAGLYSSWVLFAKIILYLIGPLLSISFVFFSSQKKARQQKKILFISLLLLIAVGFIMFVFYSFFPELIIKLIFNRNFFAIKDYLGLAAFFGVLYTAISLFNNYFVAKKSGAMLVPTVMVPTYFLCLYFWGGSIGRIIQIDLYISFATCLIYFLLAFLSPNNNTVLKASIT